MPDLLSVRISSRGLTWNPGGLQQQQRKPSPRRRDRDRITDVRALYILPIPEFEDEPPEQFPTLPVRQFSIFGFLSLAIRCASAISSGIILSAISFIFIATLFRSATPDAG